MKNFCVIEDNGGGLHLVVFRNSDENEIEYLHSGYEYCPGQLMQDLWALFCGDDPREEWDGNDITGDFILFEDLFSMETINCGWKIVADNDGAYPFRFGAAAQHELSMQIILQNPKRFECTER